MSNLAKFKERLAAYAEDNKGLPNVILKQNTDLGQACSSIVTIDNRVQGESDGQVAGRYVDEFCTAIGDTQNKASLDMFDSTIGAFTDKITTAMNALSGIRDKARELAADMQKSIATITGADPFYTKHVGRCQLSEDFPTFSWESTKRWGSKEDLARMVNSMVTVEGVDVPAELDHRLFDVVVANIDKYVKLPSIPMDSNLRSSAIDQLKAANLELSEEALTTAFDLLTGVIKNNEAFGIIRNNKVNMASELFRNIQKLEQFVMDVDPVCDAIISGLVKFDDQHQESFKAGAESLQRFCKIAAYYVQMQRETVYRDAYLLQGGMLNGDNAANFAAAGGNNKMIANYTYKMYQGDSAIIPAMGIKGDVIINSDSKIATEVEESLKAVSNKLAYIQNSAKASAFKLIAKEYVTKRFTEDAKDAPENKGILSVNINNALNKVACPIADAVKQYDVCLVEAAINLIVGIEYPGTFVEHLQKKLGAAYLTLTNLNEKVSAEDIRCAEAGVIAELIVGFIVDKMVEASVCTEPAPVEPSQTTPAPQPTPTEPLEPSPDQVKQAPGSEPAQEG